MTIVISPCVSDLDPKTEIKKTSGRSDLKYLCVSLFLHDKWPIVGAGCLSAVNVQGRLCARSRWSSRKQAVQWHARGCTVLTSSSTAWWWLDGFSIDWCRNSDMNIAFWLHSTFFFNTQKITLALNGNYWFTIQLYSKATQAEKYCLTQSNGTRYTVRKCLCLISSCFNRDDIRQLSHYLATIGPHD